MVNQYLKNRTIKPTPKTTYEPHTSVIDSSSKVPKSISKTIEELIDENGNMAFMAQFNQWFTECAEAEAELVRKLETLPVEKKQTQN